MNSALVQTKDLRVRLGTAEVLKGLSIFLHRGEIITLIGANGSGKTTFLRAISGMTAIRSGEIWYEGRRIDGMPLHDIAKMGISHVPEGRKVFASMSVRDNLELGACAHKGRHDKGGDLDRVYSFFPVLEAREKQIAGSLSGGEQQMLSMGRALMSRPRLLLLDEPSMGLSPLFVEEIALIINQINAEGVSIILVEQNARMALDLSNRAYVLELGRVVQQGAGKELIENPDVRKAYLGA